MSFISLLGGIIIGIIVIVTLIAFIGISRYVFGFYFRRCKQCGHLMFFRGKRENNEGSFFYFHCRHCGNWDKISQVDYLRQIGVDVDSNNV